MLGIFPLMEDQYLDEVIASTDVICWYSVHDESSTRKCRWMPCFKRNKRPFQKRLYTHRFVQLCRWWSEDYFRGSKLHAPLKTDWEIAEVRTDRNEPTNQPRRWRPSATLKPLQESPSRFLISGTSCSSNETSHSCLSRLMACLCSKFSSHFGRLDRCAFLSGLN